MTLCHAEVVRADVYEDGGLEAVSWLALLSLCLLRVKYAVLLEEVEAQDAFFVGLADRTR